MTTTNQTRFAPTHEITAFDRSFPVQLLDGVAYTKEEWDADASGDWEVVDGEWLFQGRAITCSVRAIDPRHGGEAMARKQIVDGAAYNRSDGRRWYISAQHPTGVAMDPTLCRWFYTREEAREELQWERSHASDS